MKYFPLSQAQKRIWYEQKKNNNSSLFNIGGIVEINGKVDMSVLKKAIIAVYSQNVAMRLRFQDRGNEVYQYISDDEPEIGEMNFSESRNPHESFELWCQAQFQIPFIMQNSSLVYFAVYRLSNLNMGYYIKLHHIISDGWSVKLLTEQVAQLYECIMNGNILRNNVLPSYLDMVLLEEEFLKSPLCDNAKQFWVSKLTPMPDINHYSHNIEGKRKTFFLDRKLQIVIENYIKREKLSLNTFFLGIYLIYMYKKNGNQDIIVGVPMLGRLGKKEKQTFGTFTNTMPYRYQVDREKSVCNLFHEVANEIFNCLRYQKYPYNLLHTELGMFERGESCFFQTCINYYNMEIITDFCGMLAKNRELYNGQQEYALQIIIRQWNERRLQLDFDYQTSSYNESQIESLYSELILLIEQVLKNDLCTVGDMLLLCTADAYRFLYKFNQTEQNFPKDVTIVDLFFRCVKTKPDNIAISKENQKISYGYLGKLTNIARCKLLQMGIRKGDIVAVIMEYDVESIVAMLSIWMCGAIYLPIEKKLPEERKKKILERAEVYYIIAKTQVSFFGGCVILSEELLIDTGAYPIEQDLSSEDISYLIYTSGSSGESKGVKVRHKSLVNYLWWAYNNYFQKEKEIFPLYSSFAFDFTLTALLTPLISGNEVRIYDMEDITPIFRRISEERQATILKITPSHIALLKEVKWEDSAIHTIIIGGEDLKSKVCKGLYELFGKQISIFNEYGPTEATIGCMTYKYRGDENEISVPIGRPINNTQIYLLDHDLKPVPYLMVGEIYIGGEGLADEYYKAEKQNQESFLENPYQPGKRIYKTGDLAYRNKRGTIVFYGRNDRQIKIRGYRIDLIEIEEYILNSGFVKEVLVKAMEMGQDGHSLCAFIVGMDRKDESKLKEYLEKNLPFYMIPELYMILDKFPLTRNGKIDEPKLYVTNQKKIVPVRKHKKEYQILIDTLSTLFPLELLESETDFFMMGGDSIKAILLSSRLLEKGYELRVSDILAYPAIHELSNKMKLIEPNSYEQNVIEGEIENTPITQLFLDKNFEREGHYNISILVECKQEVSAEALEIIFHELVKHHDSLRINIKNNERKLFYNNLHLGTKHIVQVIRIGDGKRDNRIKSLEQKLMREAKQEFDLYKDLLIRPYLVLDKQKTYFYIVMHHLITDGLSIRILLEDIEKLLTQYRNAKRLELSQKTVSCKDYAKQCRDKFHLDIEKQMEYKYSNTNMKCKYGNTSIKRFELSVEQTDKICEMAKSYYGVNIDQLLLLAYVLASWKIVGINEMAVDMESHGRDWLPEINSSRTIGWFTVMYSINFNIKEEDFITQIKELAEQMKLAARNKHMLGGNGLIRFNYLGEMVELSDSVMEVYSIMGKNDISPKNSFEYFADINTYIQGRKIHIIIRFGLVEKSVRNKIVQEYIKQIQKLIGLYSSQNTRIYTPADFELVELSQNELDNLILKKDV